MTASNRLGIPARQERTLAALIERIAGSPWLDGAILVGSMAAGRADAISDVDLIVSVRAGAFESAWQDRHQLRAAGAILWWDVAPEPEREVAAHKWLTDDLVLVEALFAGPTSGVRLAPPWRVVAGDAALPDRFDRRPPIQRTEMGENVHPVERTFDDLKATLRAHAAGDPSESDESGPVPTTGTRR
jgi:hypothetical protein